MSERTLKINKVDTILQKSYVVDQEVDLIINSASNLMFMRTGTAKRIRDRSEPLTGANEEEYRSLLQSLTVYPLIKKYMETFGVEDWVPSQAQFSASKKVAQNNGPFRLGDVVLDTEWSMHDPRDVMHVVAGTYVSNNGAVEITKVQYADLEKTLRSALSLADKNQYTACAIPVLATRGSYGIEPRLSLNAITSAIEKSTLSTIRKIVVCFESDEAREFFALTSPDSTLLSS